MNNDNIFLVSAPLLRMLAFFCVSVSILATPSQARSRPAIPSPQAANCTVGQLFLSFRSIPPPSMSPAVCVSFWTNATEDVGFMLEWTEAGQPQSTDLSKSRQSECLYGRSTNQRKFGCAALKGWFSGESRIDHVADSAWATDLLEPQGFSLVALRYDSDYCFRFRNVDRHGVISEAWSRWACAHTKIPPERPVLLAPRVTAIPATNGERVIGPSAPFRLLVEWQPAVNEDRSVGKYWVELWKDKRWIEPTGGLMANLKVSTREAVIEFPPDADPDGRYAMRVCASNAVTSACSHEGWAYGRRFDSDARTSANSRRGAISSVLSASVGNTRQAALSPSRLASGASTTSAVVAQPAAAGAAVLYGVGSDGVLRWYRHDGAAVGAGERVPGAWTIPRNVGRGWSGLKQIIAGGSGVIYGIAPDGKLFWYRHVAYLTGGGSETAGSWEPPREVSSGWAEYRTVFAGGEGVLYAVTADGQLLWFRHLGFANGAAEWAGPIAVANGWAGYTQVFSGGSGVVYTISADGLLHWQRHNGYLTGAAAWSAAQVVGHGWAGMRQVFSAGNGVIYAISQDGILRWYKHNTFGSGGGLDMPGAWQPRAEVGHGWNSFGTVFAQF